MWEGAALDDQHSRAGGAGPQPVSVGGWVAQIRNDLGVAEKVQTQLWGFQRISKGAFMSEGWKKLNKDYCSKHDLSQWSEVWFEEPFFTF